MLVLLGKSCSGKSTTQKELVRLGVTPILEYTTRPPRENEKEAKQYHFVTERKFWDMCKKNFFAVNKSYKVYNGEIWRYGIAAQDLSDEKVIVTNPKILETLKKNENIHPVVFYIKTDEDVIWDRLLARKDNIDEAQRRLIADREDFKDIEQCVDFVFVNNGVMSPALLANMIKNTYMEQINKLKNN